jgi:hypothetical protein
MKPVLPGGLKISPDSFFFHRFLREEMKGQWEWRGIA